MRLSYRTGMDTHQDPQRWQRVRSPNSGVRPRRHGTSSRADGGLSLVGAGRARVRLVSNPAAGVPPQTPPPSSTRRTVVIDRAQSSRLRGEE